MHIWLYGEEGKMPVLISVFFVYILARRKVVYPQKRIILSGIALNFLFSILFPLDSVQSFGML